MLHRSDKAMQSTRSTALTWLGLLRRKRQLRFLLTGDFQSMLETLRGQLDIPTRTTTPHYGGVYSYREEIESGCPASTRGPTASIKATWERRPTGCCMELSV